ncbi:hypothetical protein F5Y19DRAFT_189965 [Xylariaceae sp. FL1651]|nr:hypothetical protein F5Y19DRAFT_189965 [Xylariaceae sp. FL1651]
MASVASASPSGQSFLHADSTEDTDSWQYVETNSPPAGFIPSPASSSFNGWGIIGYPNQMGTSPTAMSPLPLDLDFQFGRPPPTSYPNQQNTSTTAASDVESQLLSALDDQQFAANQELLFSGLLGNAMSMSPYQPALQQCSMGDMSGFEEINAQSRPADLDIPLQYRDDSNVAPWAPMNMQDDGFSSFVLGDINAHVSPPASQLSPGNSSHQSSPSMPPARPRLAKGTDPIKKIRGSGRVEKNSAPLDNFVVVTPNTINQQSGKPNPFECFEVVRSTHRGRKGPLANKAAESALNVRRLGACFCCRSRKVKCDEERPCKNCKKILAQVPQIVCWQFSDFLPVLFPDFIRGHFKKDAMTRFISDNVSEFYDLSSEPCSIELSAGLSFRSTLTLPASLFSPKSTEILQHWHLGIGVHQLELQSRGAVPIGVDPKNSSQREMLKRRTREYVQNLVNEPRYAEEVTNALRGTQLPRRILTIVQQFAQRSQSTMVKQALAIYATHYVLTRQLCLTPSTITRLQHLQQTQAQTRLFLPANICATSLTTTRILNRQIKAVLDEYLLKETQSLFGAFSSALKPRSRAGWAPCLASFLVLCLLMESIEATADTFVVSEAEIALRTRRRSTFGATTDTNKVGGGGGFTVGGRRQALDLCREIDNLPFRQVAYRFHAVYQTHHVREPGVGSAPASSSGNMGATVSGNGNGGTPFNPLLDPTLDADLEPAAAAMAISLRALLEDDDSWHELDFLVADPILSGAEAHPYPRDITLDYTGRLIARFLLSFTDEKYLFDGQY